MMKPPHQATAFSVAKVKMTIQARSLKHTWPAFVAVVMVSATITTTRPWMLTDAAHQQCARDAAAMNTENGESGQSSKYGKF